MTDEPTHRERERTLLAVPGARFFDRDGQTMFAFVIDSNNIIGPRLAKKADAAQYPGEYAAFAGDQRLDMFVDYSNRDPGAVDPDADNGGRKLRSASRATSGPGKPGRPRKHPVV